MSKAQFLFMAAFVGFYGLLFALLLARALAELFRARLSRVTPAVAKVSGRVKVARRAWTDAVRQSHFAHETIERRGSSVSHAG